MENQQKYDFNHLFEFFININYQTIFPLKLLTGLENMKLRRAELQTEIDTQEEEKTNLQREIEKMSYKLTRINDSLGKRICVRNEYDRTIADTESAYMKVKNRVFIRPKDMQFSKFINNHYLTS